MTCGDCPNTDGYHYTSYPAKVKCTITGEYHCFSDECDCNPIQVRDEKQLNAFKDMLSDTTSTIRFEDLVPVDRGTHCLVCGEGISLSMSEHGPKICEECKKAILFIKEHFRYDEV